MTKIDIFSGFLGAGKTTLIKKLISEAYAGEKLVLVENEFGEIGIDGGFMQDAGINVTEMNSGCICCSLTGDFRAALTEVRRQYAPDRIIIEPSGVGKLSDVVAAVESCEDSELVINALVTVVDAAKAKMYMKNFGEFYNNQIASAGCIVLSRTQNLSEEKLEKALSLIREQNSGAVVITTPWDSLSGRQILEAMEQKDTLSAALEAMELDHEEEECDDPDCDCHHHHDDDCDCDCDCEDEHDHDHGHSYEVEGYSILETHSHEGATICSFEKDVKKDLEVIKVAMEESIKELVDWLDSTGALIGHVKGYIKEAGPITTFSTTGSTLNIEEHDAVGATVGFASIVFGPEEEELKDKVVEVFERL